MILPIYTALTKQMSRRLENFTMNQEMYITMQLFLDLPNFILADFLGGC